MAHQTIARDDDDDTIGGSTWASMSLAISDEGTCPKHPHIKLRETGPDGFVYQKESCPECDREFQSQRQSLRDRKRELDLQLQQLNLEDDNPVLQAEDDNDGGEIEEEKVVAPPVQQEVLSEGTSGSRGTSPFPRFPVPQQQSTENGYSRPTQLTLESLANQMTMMQQMQDWLLQQKETEMNSLRAKVESYQQQLLQKEVEIALLKEKLNQQETRMKQEIKMARLSAAAANKRLDKSSGRGNKEEKRIHIQELHVQVGANLNDSQKEGGDFDAKVVQEATKKATTLALEKAASAAEQQESESHENAKGKDISETLPIKPPPPTKKDNNNNSLKQQQEITFVPENGNKQISKTNSEDDDEEESKDCFNPKTPWAPPSLLGSKQSSRKPAPGTTPADSAAAAKAAPISKGETGLPAKNSIKRTGAPTGEGIPWEIQDDGPPTVPLEEDVTIGTMDQQFFKKNTPGRIPSVNPYPGTNDDERSIGGVSLGNTVASSTYGEDRQKVVSQILLDPYGDKGRYSGVVLRSTGMPHGLGRMVYEDDGRTYEGDWRHGRWHGFGRATFANGDSYEGEYRFDQRHGRGKYCWSDGRIYDGEFAEDKRHGKGTFKWPDGATYEGDFHQGQREGHGRYTFSDGGYYTGSWVDGRYEGFGECHWEDGRKYKGEWRAGMAHGQGVETYPDGKVRHDGQWIDDEPIRVNR